jgi:hypothetical protein
MQGRRVPPDHGATRPLACPHRRPGRLVQESLRGRALERLRIRDALAQMGEEGERPPFAQHPERSEGHP